MLLGSLTEPIGDDALTVVGRSPLDKRYDTLGASSVTVFVKSNYVAGLLLT